MKKKDIEQINGTLDSEISSEVQAEAQNETQSEAQEVKDEQKAIETLKKFASEEEDDDVDISLRAILGGDILQSKFLMKQVLFIMFCVMLMLLYTGNRYASQQDSIVIDSLRTRLQEVKYNVLTQSSVMMNTLRQSNLERKLKEGPDSTLETPITPPFLIGKDSIE